MTSQRIEYPNARRDETVVDTYHNKHQIADPYRWLENPSSTETTEWINQQTALFSKYMQDNAPSSSNSKHLTETMREELTKMMDYEKVGCPFKRGDRIFYYKNNGLQNQSVLYMKPFDNGNGFKSYDDQSRVEVFVDPNTFAEDGTSALGSNAFSKEGEYFAYGIKEKGSDWQSIHIKNVATKENLPEVLKYCKFVSIAWDGRGQGFFYTRFPEPKQATDSLGSETEMNELQAVYYHKLNTPQDQDVVVYKTDDHPQWMFGLQTTNDKQYLVITISESTARVNRFYVARLNADGGDDDQRPLYETDENGLIKVEKVIDNFDAEYDYLHNDGPVFLIKTNLNAKKSRIVKIDVSSRDNSSDENREIIELIPESQDPLDMALVVAENHIVCCYTHKCQDRVAIYDVNGTFLNFLEFPAPGSMGGIAGRRQEPYLFYSFMSFTYPGTIFSYDFETRESTLYYQTKTSDLILPPDAFETKQGWSSSRDGTKIPMFIVHKKGLDLTSQDNPTWLYGYGGFSVNLQPYFSVLKIFYLQYFNGVYAVPALRGGGEFGEEWHEAGIKDKKQNGFDDMICAAEYLIDSKITRPEKLWINGGSNGGLLVAACTNQRPELFGAAVAHVGVLDMLRFHKFTIGKHWTSDYGCSDNEEDFEYLIKYSPLHNINKDKQYPSYLVMTSDHDDRVVPLHSFKFVAELQHKLGSTNERPLLIRIETKAGHGAGKPLSKTILEWSEIFAFLANELKL